MTKSFDEWFLDNFKSLDDERFDSCEDAWNAGQQSKQAEIDELRGCIDFFDKYITQKFEDDGWIDSIEMQYILSKLKGNTNED